MAAPKLPPRQPRPRLPLFHPAAKPKTPTVYHWGQPNPGYGSGPIKGVQQPGVFTYGAGKTTPGGSYAAGGAAPAAQAPSAPSSAVLPPDPSYEGTVGALGRQRDTTLSALSGQRTSGLLNYGYNEDATTGALAFDPSNPYSQAAQMKKRYDESRQGTGNRMAAGGNLYAGSYQQGQDIVNRDQGRSEDALLKSLMSFLAGNTGSRAKAQTDYELGVAGAESDRLGRASSNPLYSPTGDEAPPAATPAAAAAASRRLPIYGKKPGSRGLGYGSRR